MFLSNSSPTCARFDQFEVDLSSGVLQRSGVRVPVQAQPLQVLRLLLQADGKVVTREELRKVLWPEDTFVDFELGVNTAVKKLRQALADPADRPKFIETLPKVGYRFLVPVEWVPEDGYKSTTPKVGDSAASREIAVVPAPQGQGQVDRAVKLDGRASSNKKWVWLAMCVAAAVLLCWALWRTVGGRTDEASAAIEVVPLVSMSGEQGPPAVSPDGSEVAFRYGDGQHAAIYIALVGGEKPLQLTDYGFNDDPTWSPDGREIAFNHFDDKQANKSIYVVPALGGLERRLSTISSPKWGHCNKMSWSPDAKSIIVTEALADGARARLALLSLSDLTVRPLTAPVNQQFDCDPTFSPDGTKIAFVRGSMGAFVGDLFVLKLAGGEPKRLTFDNSGGDATWTQDGKDILFSSPSQGTRSLWRISATGGKSWRVLGAGDYAWAPSMSRKGNQLAYWVAKHWDGVWQLNLKDERHAAGPPVRILSANGFSWRPNFSPDGKKVVFESDRMGYSDIWVCDRDGTNCNQLTALRGQAGTARWSPDGRYIAFEAMVNSFYEVYVVEAAGGIPRVISTFSDGNNGAPNWSRDGQYIYFYSAHENGPYQLWKVALKGGPPVRVTTQGGVYAVESEDQRSLYYAKFEQDGIFKMPLGGGVETQVLNKPGAGDWCLWTLTPGGIYFVNRNAPPNGRIEYFEFATGQSTPILSLEKASPQFGGLTLSPDGKSLLYGQSELDESYVMLVKNFR
jgi:Tol biopolymer transport system component/DNA-binding winged helix-turn-helix (wHTH) protein